MWVDRRHLLVCNNLVSYLLLSHVLALVSDSRVVSASSLLPLNTLKLGNISSMKLWTSSSTALDREDILAMMLKRNEKLSEF
jgi:hypothetical protein